MLDLLEDQTLDEPVSTRTLLGVDIEVIHAQTWSSDYHGRLMFGLAFQLGEYGVMQYVRPRALADEYDSLRSLLERCGVGGDCMVLAHNASFDLGAINGWLMRLGDAPLPPMQYLDTYRHTYKHGGTYSKNLANTARQLGIPFPKGHVERWDWDEAAMWDDQDALDAIRAYNENDVRLLFPVHAELLKRGLIKGPEGRLWKP
jgi:hypothetical protein